MKFIFKLAFCGLILMALWFLGQAVVDLWIYSRLDQQVTPTSITWSIREISPSSYRLIASYSFEVQGVGISSQSELSSPQLLNRYAAERELSYIEQDGRQTIWYSSSNPQRNALQKNFPIRPAFRLG